LAKDESVPKEDRLAQEEDLMTRVTILKRDLERKREEVKTLSYVLEGYKVQFETWNSNITGLQNRIQQLESENIMLQQPIQKESQPLSVIEGSLASKIGYAFFCVALILLLLHYTHVTSVHEFFRQVDGLLSGAQFNLPRILNLRL